MVFSLDTYIMYVVEQQLLGLAEKDISWTKVIYLKNNIAILFSILDSFRSSEPFEGSLVLHQQQFPYNGAFPVQMHFLLKRQVQKLHR